MSNGPGDGCFVVPVLGNGEGFPVVAAETVDDIFERGKLIILPRHEDVGLSNKERFEVFGDVIMPGCNLVWTDEFECHEGVNSIDQPGSSRRFSATELLLRANRKLLSYYFHEITGS